MATDCATMPEVAATIAILVTRRCNMTCAHCSVESSPRVNTKDPSEEELLDTIRQAASAGVKAVQFTGGEPMMRQKVVLNLMRATHAMGLSCGLTTNGFWGKNPRMARKLLKEMLRYGLQYMTVSYDRYHAEFMGPQPILNIAEIARELGFYFNVNVTRTLQDENLDEYARLFGDHPNIRMRLYDVQPVGRARNFDMPSLRAEVEGFCNAAAQATITEDGRMIACNGPAYFDPADSPRSVGDCHTTPVGELLHRHWDDPILHTIRTFGPAGLRDELLKEPAFAARLDRRFAGQCDLCHVITNDPEMTAHLRSVLSDSRHAALRAAKWKLIRGARTSGALSRENANGAGMIGLMVQVITTNAVPADAEKLWGRADIDWDNLAKYLAGSGQAGRLVQPHILEQISRWAPPYFTKTLQRRAMGDAMRELSHRETLDLLHEQLKAAGIKGHLLKGAALYLQERAHGITPERVPGDIDLWISNSAQAADFRRQMLAAGFAGDPDAPRTGPHHLAPISWRNSAVEIHTGVMPGFWGLPEAAMAGRAVAVSGYDAFATLSPADMILHEAIHSTTHLYSFGMKLAVDMHRIMRLAQVMGTPIDWDALASAANATRCPRAFWAPLVALQQGIGAQLPVDASLFSHAPTTEQFRRMTIVASKRIFTATDDADQMNPFTRNGIFLLLHNSPVGAARYLVELSRGDAAESRRTALGGSGGQSWKNLRNHLRNAWLDLNAFRRAIR